jgi:hypothetical protein
MHNLQEFKPSGESLNHQCALVLSELRKGPRTTLDFRDIFVSHPSGRVMSLRKAGFDILTRRRGAWAEYVLIEQGGAA